MPQGDEDYRRLDADVSALRAFLAARLEVFNSLPPDQLAAAEGPNSILDRAWIPYLMRLGPRPDHADQFREHPHLPQFVAIAGFTNPAS